MPKDLVNDYTFDIHFDFVFCIMFVLGLPENISADFTRVIF